MATFRCGKCGCEEDSALCNYWPDRLRDRVPVCSVCDPRIGKWHGQFPRLFGAFLVKPCPTRRPNETLASLLGRLAGVGLDERMTEPRRQPGEGAAALGGTFSFSDPVPSYKPRSAAS
jgi:hypothetical protein